MKGFSLKNIVVTEDETIKILDTFFHREFITVDCLENVVASNNFNEFLIYEDLANLIFKMICPDEKVKNWAGKLRMIRGKCSREFYHFFNSKIYSKSIDKSK